MQWCWHALIPTTTNPLWAFAIPGAFTSARRVSDASGSIAQSLVAEQQNAMTKQGASVIQLVSSKTPPELTVREASVLLVRVAEERDRAAFTVLFKHFGPRLKAFLLRTEHDEDRVESVVQDVMVSVWRKAHTFDPSKSNASTWMFTMARNRLIDTVRQEGRRRRLSDELAREPDATEESGTDYDIERWESGEQIKRLMKDLPAEQARAVVLAFIEGKSHRDIADDLGVPVGTIKSRIRLAFKRMRANLGEVEVDF